MPDIRTTCRAIVFGLVVVAAGLLPRSLGAQRLVAVKGLIIEDSTLVALPDVEIRFITLGRGTRTDGLPAGSRTSCAASPACGSPAGTARSRTSAAAGCQWGNLPAGPR